MDIPREHSARRASRWWLLSAAVLVVVALGWWGTESATGVPRVDAEAVRIDTVLRSDFVIEISAHGVLRSSELQWVTARSGGRVSAVHKKAGESVVPGEVLLELGNPDLVNVAEEARSALSGSKAGMLSYKVDLENQLLNQKSRALQARFAYESALLKLQAETRLRENSNIIADIDFQRTQLQVEQLRSTYEIEKERSAKSDANVETQLAARQAQVDQLSRAFERARDAVDALTVRAGMDGVVQKLDLEVGQQLAPGDPVAKIARRDQLYAELKVQARQAADVRVGQNVMIDTRNARVPGQISRVDPAVQEGIVIVDVRLLGAIPGGARPELSVEGVITVAHQPDTLVVGIPSDGRGQSRFSVYRLMGSGDIAERVGVRAGRASIHQVEILEGLNPGDRIVLSDTRDWRKWDRVRISR